MACVAAPARLHALQAAQAAQPASPAESQAAPNAAPASSADDSDNKFLQSANVRKIAQMLHLSVEATEAIFLGINFVVLALAIGIPLFRWLPKALSKQSSKVRDDLESARKMTTEANARLSAIEAKLAGLDGEIAAIRAQVEEESRQDEARIKSTIGEESARIVAAAEQEIASAAAQARRSLRGFAADLAFAQAGEQLKLTAETDKALLDEFLHEVAGGVAGNGGQTGGRK